MRANPHMTPPRAPFRGSPAASMAQRPAAAPMFAAAAGARAGGPKYPDPTWSPKPGGNALPAQHAVQQLKDAPSAAPQGAMTGTTQAPQRFAGAAAARLGGGQQQPAAAYVKPQEQPLAPQKPKTAVGVATEDLGTYAANRDASQRHWQDVATARAQAQMDERQKAMAQAQAGRKAYDAVEGSVRGVFEDLADPTTAQPAPGWDWQKDRGWMPQEEGIDTPKEGIDEYFLDVLSGSPEDYLMPEDVMKAKQAGLFNEAAIARRKLNDQLGARGIGASGIAASQLGGIDVATQQAIGDLEAQDWAQAQEAYQNRLQTLGGLAMQGLSEENRLKVLDAQMESEKQAAAWTAAQEFAASVGADRWSPEAIQAYWKHILAGKSPEEAAAALFTTIGEGDEKVVVEQPDAATNEPGNDNAQLALASKEVQSGVMPEDVAATGNYTAEQWAGFTPEERLMIIRMIRTGVAG